jgi:hypothetical protein
VTYKADPVTMQVIRYGLGPLPMTWVIT